MGEPTQLSNALILRLNADCVMLRSVAARVKFRVRASDSKSRNQFRSIGFPLHKI